jgi:hypothetical protein
MLSGCDFLSGSPPPPPALTPGPRPIGCPPIEEAIIGAWQRDGYVEEFRGEGTYVLNGQEGAFRFRSPGHVVLDVGGRHEEHVVGLSDVNELISADESLIGHVSARISPAPPIPASCYDLRTSIVGTWLGGEVPEAFGRDDSYRAGDRTGTWSMPTSGHLTIRTSTGTSERVFAQLSDTTAMSFEREDGAHVTLYSRAL